MGQAPILLTNADCQRLLSPLDVVAQIEAALAWEDAGAIAWPTPRSLNIAPDRWGNDYHVKMCVLEAVPVGGIDPGTATQEQLRHAHRVSLGGHVQRRRALTVGGVGVRTSI